MLSDEKICKLWGDVDGTRNGYAPFARSIELEATAPLLRQIAGDEAVMLYVLAIIELMRPRDVISTGARHLVIQSLRQRLENKK